MNPAKTALSLIGKPVGAVSHALNRPSAAGRNRPLYPLNLLDALRGDSLEDAVRDRVALITGASSGIGAVTARRIGEVGGEVVLSRACPASAPTSPPRRRWTRSATP